MSITYVKLNWFLGRKDGFPGDCTDDKKPCQLSKIIDYIFLKAIV